MDEGGGISQLVKPTLDGQSMRSDLEKYDTKNTTKNKWALTG
jgi:hypothetical protein